MKRFDPKSITTRWNNWLDEQPDWKARQEGGATDQFLEAAVEPLAEVARYGEHLLREMKWATSKNFSSVKHISRLVGKKLDRKRSAIGTIIVSHSTPPIGTAIGEPRYQNLGSTLLDIDQLSEYDDGSLDETKTGSYVQSLTPWLETSFYTIPVGATFTNSVNGLSYIAAENKTISNFTNKWSRIKRNQSMKDAFYANGGWEGYKYLSVPVVQGVQKSIILTTDSPTDASQSYIIDTLNIEAADSYYTKQFCYLEVIDGVEVSQWTEVYHLATVDATSKSFEINILDNMTGTEIKFGDGINGAIPPKGSTLILHYLETAGEEGNVQDLYSFDGSISGYELPEGLNYSIGCQNMWGIFGGKDLETLKEFKSNAETAYEKNYEIMHTYTEFVRRLNEVAPVPILKPKIKSSWITQDISGVKVLTPAIGVTGLNGNLQKLTTVEQNLFNKVTTNKISDNVLSSKYVIYEEPNILKINSRITLELKENVISPDAFTSELEEGLQQKIGKYNLDAIDCYRQVRVIQEALDLSDNIASIDTVDLITLSPSDIALSSNIISSVPYIVFTFELPSTDMNRQSANGYCIKTRTDGNYVNALLNLNIGTLQSSALLLEPSEEIPSTYYTMDGDFSLANEGTRIIETCENTYKTLSRSQISGLENITTDENNEWVKSITYDSTTFTIKIGIPAANFLDYLNLPSNTSNSDILSIIETKFGKNTASFELAFECPDKTLNLTDWNSVWYYDNIEIEIDS